MEENEFRFEWFEWFDLDEFSGWPLLVEVTRLGEVTHLSLYSLILIWSRLHDGWGDPPHLNSPIWGPPPPCKQAVRACLHVGGGFRVGEVNRSDGVARLTILSLIWSPTYPSCKRDHIKMRDYMDKRVTSPLGSPPPCKQALSLE